jgi:uncharacterized protein GlcG (DUF336 family)
MPAHGPVAITLSDARTIVVAALKHARSGQYPPMTVAVLDTAGELVAFAREDGSSLLRGRIARAKARGALNMGSRSLAARAAAHRAFINSVVSPRVVLDLGNSPRLWRCSKRGALADGDLVPAAGGVLVRDDDNNVIGAVGVSGSLPDDDEACAIHGIAAAVLRADPGAADPT